jgi:hypothetical protein
LAGEEGELASVAIIREVPVTQSIVRHANSPQTPRRVTDDDNCVVGLPTYITALIVEVLAGKHLLGRRDWGRRGRGGSWRGIATTRDTTLFRLSNTPSSLY